MGEGILEIRAQARRSSPKSYGRDGQVWIMETAMIRLGKSRSKLDTYKLFSLVLYVTRRVTRHFVDNGDDLLTHVPFRACDKKAQREYTHFGKTS